MSQRKRPTVLSTADGDIASLTQARIDRRITNSLADIALAGDTIPVRLFSNLPTDTEADVRRDVNRERERIMNSDSDIPPI